MATKKSNPKTSEFSRRQLAVARKRAAFAALDFHEALTINKAPPWAVAEAIELVRFAAAELRIAMSACGQPSECPEHLGPWSVLGLENVEREERNARHALKVKRAWEVRS